MSSGFAKLIGIIPYLDGGVRRRLSAGTIVLISFTFLFPKSYISILDINLTYSLAKVITSPIFAIFAILIIYAAGGLVEVIADMFFAKLAGNMRWLFTAPKYWHEKHRRLEKLFPLKPKAPLTKAPLKNLLFYYFGILLKLLSFYFLVIPLFLIECIKVTYGISSFNWERGLKRNLSLCAYTYFEKLPEAVRAGLQSPFGNSSDFSWEYFCNNGIKEEIETAKRLRERSKDALVIITSAMIPMIIMMSKITEFIFFFVSGIYNTGNTYCDIGLFALLVGPFLISFSVLLLLAYVLIVLQSMFSILELKALNKENFTKREIKTPFYKEWANHL